MVAEDITVHQLPYSLASPCMAVLGWLVVRKERTGEEIFFIRTMFVQVVGEIAQTILSECHPSLLRSFSQHGHDPFFAIQIAHTQIDEFRDADVGIIEQPEDSSIADRRSFSKQPGLMGRSTSQQELFKLFGGNGLDERPAHFGKDYAIEWSVLQDPAMDEPVKEGTN